jgi:hypothetical protein
MNKINPCFDLQGETIGKWQILEKVPTPTHLTQNDKHAFWLCKCSCGHKSIVRGYSLRTGRSKSCGCGTLNQSRDSK